MFGYERKFQEPEQRDGCEPGGSACTSASIEATLPVLSDHEGNLLALLLRCEPATPYQLLRLHVLSPFSRLNESKGSLYPLVRRLERQGLLASRPVNGDRRNARLLTCTDRGRAAVRAWISRIDPTNALPDDPLLIKIGGLALLSGAEQREWVMGARRILERKIQTLESHGATVEAFSGFARTGAMLSLIVRLEWLELLSRCLSPGANLAPPIPAIAIVEKKGSKCTNPQSQPWAATVPLMSSDPREPAPGVSVSIGGASGSYHSARAGSVYPAS